MKNRLCFILGIVIEIILTVIIFTLAFGPEVLLSVLGCIGLIIVYTIVIVCLWPEVGKRIENQKKAVRIIVRIVLFVLGFLIGLFGFIIAIVAGYLISTTQFF